MAPTTTSRASSTSHTRDVEEGPQMRIRALLVVIIAIVDGGCGDAGEGGAAGEEYEIINPVLREPDVVSVQVGSCKPVEVHSSEDASIDR